MRKGIIWVAAAAAGVLMVPVAASAQEARGNLFTKPIGAPSRALEIAVGGGYAQPFGNISTAPGQALQDFTNAGAAVNLDIGYRATPNFMVGVYGQYGQYDSDFARVTARDFSGGLQANFHLAPDVGMDPWIGIGSGYHGFWLVPDNLPNSNYSGWEIVRGRLGADFRVSNELAIGPQVGAAMTLYFSEKLPGDTSFHSINSNRLNGSVFAGLYGRFDMAGTSVKRVSTVAGR